MVESGRDRHYAVLSALDTEVERTGTEPDFLVVNISNLSQNTARLYAVYRRRVDRCNDQPMEMCLMSTSNTFRFHENRINF